LPNTNSEADAVKIVELVKAINESDRG